MEGAVCTHCSYVFIDGEIPNICEGCGVRWKNDCELVNLKIQAVRDTNPQSFNHHWGNKRNIRLMLRLMRNRG